MEIFNHMKYLLVASMIAIGISAPCTAMSSESADPDFEPQKLQNPLRFGPIDLPERVTRATQSKVKEFMKQLSFWHHCDNYKKNRLVIAQAIRCGYNPSQFLYGAIRWQDYYLLKDCFDHGCSANEKTGDFDNLLIFEARSLLIAQYLIEHGADRTRTDGYWGTVIHRACCADYSPDVLQYHIESGEIPINDTSGRRNKTPLHVWATVSTQGSRSSTDLIQSASEKLRLLFQAHANSSLRDAQDRTPLDILRSRKEKYAGHSVAYAREIAIYDALVSQLSSAIQKNYKRKHSELDEQTSCPICLEPFKQKSNKKKFFCEHLFHEKCIKSWIKDSDHQDCPVCRAEREET